MVVYLSITLLLLLKSRILALCQIHRIYVDACIYEFQWVPDVIYRKATALAYLNYPVCWHQNGHSAMKCL